MGSACEIFRRQFGWKVFVYIHLLCRTIKEKLKIQGHHPFKVVICGKYINLNKITKNSHISLKFNRLLISVILYSLQCKIERNREKCFNTERSKGIFVRENLKK